MSRLLFVSLVMLLAACGSRAPETPGGALTANVWEAADIAGHGVRAGITSYVVFEEQGRVSGIGACNWFAGPYRLVEDTLRIGPIETVQTDCSPEVMEQEARFLAALEETEGFEITQEGFLLLIPSSSGTPTQLAPRREDPFVETIREE